MAISIAKSRLCSVEPRRRPHRIITNNVLIRIIDAGRAWVNAKSIRGICSDPQWACASYSGSPLRTQQIYGQFCTIEWIGSNRLLRITYVPNWCGIKSRRCCRRIFHTKSQQTNRRESETKKEKKNEPSGFRSKRVRELLSNVPLFALRVWKANFHPFIGADLCSGVQFMQSIWL